MIKVENKVGKNIEEVGDPTFGVIKEKRKSEV